MTLTDDIQRFIARWQASGAAERANYQLFLSELCDALNTPRPDPTTSDEAGNAYIFEKSAPLPHVTAGHMDLCRRDRVVRAESGDHLDQAKVLLKGAYNGVPPKWATSGIKRGGMGVYWLRQVTEE
jgi:MmeI, N-terminal domain